MSVLHLDQRGDFSAAVNVGIKCRDFLQDIMVGAMARRRHGINRVMTARQGMTSENTLNTVPLLTFQLCTTHINSLFIINLIQVILFFPECVGRMHLSPKIKDTLPREEQPRCD